MSRELQPIEIEVRRLRMSDPVPTGSVQGRCDGGYACLAVEHIEGCFTGEGDPDAAKGLYVARLRAEVERLREALTGVAIETCREWCDEKANYCHAPAEFLIWGKLIPPNGLGPRCYDHAAEHVGHRALGDPSWAIVDLRPARAALAGSPLVSGEPSQAKGSE